tara:strand:+ start:7358 stop:7552 length:195 start_codon:yes stop_codon:yes gene_type:complete
MSKKFWTLVIRYDVDGEPCDPPPHIQDRLAMAMNVLHEMGYGMEVTYGLAEPLEEYIDWQGDGE